MSKQMAVLNTLDRRLIWFLGLVGSAAILMLVLFLSVCLSQSFRDREDKSGCREDDSSCQQEQFQCEETKSGNTGECAVDDESQPPQEVKLRHEFIVKPDHNPGGSQLIMNWPGLDLRDLVTESRLRAFIPGKIICNGSRFAMSEFIYFDRTRNVLDANEAKKIREFMVSPEQVKQLWLFGFTSPDGENDRNHDLSMRRACAVQKEILKIANAPITTGIFKMPIGEDNPINGIANSRSVVIAACRAAPGEAETAGKPDTTPPACPAPD